MKDGTIFGTKEAHVRATTLCVRQSLEPFLSDRLLRNHSISDTFGGFSYSYAIAAECKFGTWHCHTDARQTLLNIPRKACIKYKVCDGGHLLLHEAVRLALIGYFADALWPPICLGGFNFTVQGYIFLRLLKILIELFSIWILEGNSYCFEGLSPGPEPLHPQHELSQASSFLPTFATFSFRLAASMPRTTMGGICKLLITYLDMFFGSRIIVYCNIHLQFTSFPAVSLEKTVTHGTF